MEELARLRATHDWESARAALSAFAPRVTALLRAAGIDARRSASLAAESLGIALAASRHPLGQWVLDPHADAASEVRWAGTLDGSIRTVQVDRVFRAGSAPLATGDQHWWIVDYKSADPGSAADLSKLRPFYAPQLELYASVLRLLHGTQTPIRAGIYYPRALKLDWWEIKPR
jgi:ATP-dependent exoDNAse (exonuclease V) beta subunit